MCVECAEGRNAELEWKLLKLTCLKVENIILKIQVMDTIAH